MADKPDMRAIAETPEFQKAVAEAAAKAAAAAVAEIMKGNAAPVTADAATKSLFSEMALAIAQMNNQGTSRAKPVAPEVMQQRLAAAEKATALLAEIHHNLKKARESGDAKRTAEWSPEYRVVAKVYFNERMIEPFRKAEARGAPPIPQEIVWTGMPNDALRPLNVIAEKLYDLYRESVGAAPRLKAVSGPNGGQVAQDSRPYWMTPGGLVVKGDPPPKAFVASQHEFKDDLGVRDNDDPSAPFVHVLGTIANPARRNFADPALPRPAR